MIGTLGLLHLVSEKPEYAIKNIGLLKSSAKPWLSAFLLLLFKSTVGVNFVNEFAEGSTQQYITLGSIRSFCFKYPGDKIVMDFNAHISSIFNKINANNYQVQKLKSLRDTLLPKLMSGQVVVH